MKLASSSMLTFLVFAISLATVVKIMTDPGAYDEKKSVHLVKILIFVVALVMLESVFAKFAGPGKG